MSSESRSRLSARREEEPSMSPDVLARAPRSRRRPRGGRRPTVRPGFLARHGRRVRRGSLLDGLTVFAVLIGPFLVLALLRAWLGGAP